MIKLDPAYTYRDACDAVEQYTTLLSISLFRMHKIPIALAIASDNRNFNIIVTITHFYYKYARKIYETDKKKTRKIDRRKNVTFQTKLYSL